MNTESFQTPKELSETFSRDYDILISCDYICRIRMEAGLDPSSNIFVRGLARASDLLEWLKRHPNFKPRKRNPR